MPKIKWREVTGFRQATLINLTEEIDLQTEGIYDGFQDHVGDNDSRMHYIKIDGEVRSFWGSKVLDDRLKEAEVGSPVRLTFLGKVKTQTAGRKVNTFKVEIGETEDGEEPDPAPKKATPTKVGSPKEEEDDDVPF